MTPAGPTDNDGHVQAINQAFALFRRNYHNQYYRALPNEQELQVAKRLWLKSLMRFSPETIMAAASSVIEQSEFMPTLATMIRHCETAAFDRLPDAHAAYVEACRAPSPKAAFDWSHPAVYHAGRECDWQFLQGSPEAQAFPVFKQVYARWCRAVTSGQEVAPPQQPTLPMSSETALDREQSQEKLKKLRENLNFL